MAQAVADAHAFRDLFEGFEHWVVAGSVRREVPTVGDVEHVVVGWKVREQLDTMVDGGLFAHPNREITKAVYPDGRHRWGDRYRGVMFRGFRHEVFFADPDNFGAILAIRTGPADYSRWLVTRLRERGTPMEDGFVTDRNGEILPCASEESFFLRCGERWESPKRRAGPQEGGAA